MPTGTNYPVAIVIVNLHEPEGETAGRLIELAEEQGYGVRSVEASRGDHDAALSFRVPQDVADAFNVERAERWPLPVPEEQDTTPRDTSIPVTDDQDKIENDGESTSDQDAAAVDEDAYAADQAREAASDDNDTNTHPARKARTSKPKE